MPRKGPPARRRSIMRLVANQPSVEPTRRPRKQNTPMHEDWSVVAREGVIFFNKWGVRDPNVRRRVIETIMERWHAVQPLRNDLRKGNEELNQKEKRLKEIEIEQDLILKRLIHHPQDPTVIAQRIQNLRERKKTSQEIQGIIDRLIPQIRLLRRRLRPTPGGIKKELNSLAKPFWENMVEFLVELSAK